MKAALVIGGIGVMVLIAGCGTSLDPSHDVGSVRARALPADALSGLDLTLPLVTVDSRGFRQTWGRSQSSLELAEYIHELELTSGRIDALREVPASWQRFGRKLREEAREKAVGLMRAQGGVTQDQGILLPVAAAEGYAGAYVKMFKQTHDEEFAKNVTNISVTSLFDILIEGIKDGSLKGQLDKVGVDESSIPMRLVRKASGARGDQSCGLDGTDKKLRVPTKGEMFWAYFWKDCYARQLMYATVKEKLVEAKRNPEVQKILAGEFEKQFPPKFKDGFREGFSKTLGGMHLTLQKKIQPQQTQDLFPSFTFLEPYWRAAEPGHSFSPYNPSVVTELTSQTEDNSNVWVNLEQLGLMLGGQSQVAADLLDSQVRGSRTLGLIAAYGAMEKMLFLLGRPGAVVKNGLVVTKPQNSEQVRRGEAPEVLVEPRGGAAFNLATRKLEAWDLDKDLAGDVATKVYPQWLVVSRNGKVVQVPEDEAVGLHGTSDLRTLVALVDGALSFAEVATSDRTLALKFNDAEKVLDEQATSALFAKELKDLPLGVAATALKTIVAEHMIALDADGRPLSSLKAPELAGLSLRESSGTKYIVDAEATARALIVMSRLARELEPGGSLADRKDLAEVKSQLAMALPFVTLNLGRVLQEADGGFYSRYDMTERKRLEAGKRKFRIQTIVLQAHFEVYRLYGSTEILRRTLRLLGFLKSELMWSGRARFFRSEEGAWESQFRAQDLLRLMSVCLAFRDATQIPENFTQARALAERVGEFLEEASISKEFESLGLVTP